MRGKLGDREAWLSEAGLRVLQTYLQMKKPNDLLVEADKLRDGTATASRTHHPEPHLPRVQTEGGRGPRAANPRSDEGALRSPPAASFTADKGEYSRAYWEKVWFTPEK